MDFLKRNSGKIALLAIIAFFTLPFIYGNEEEEDFSPFAVKSGMSYQANPISKLANKIASFYGFSKPAPQMTASAKGTDSIKNKVSFSKENPFGPQAKNRAKSSDDTLVASSRNFKNFDADGLNSNSNIYNSGGYSGGSYVGSSSARSDNPVKGYVQVNGQNYAVIEDAKGERYVVTPKGHIPYKELTKRVISAQEFNTKKQLTGADDVEVLRALQQEKARQAYAGNTNRQNYQNASTSYRGATSSNMGGMNYARVSTTDKGFDTDALSDAYVNLKNVNLKIDTSSSSARSGSYSSGGALRDSFGNAANEELEDINENITLTPQTIAGQVKAETEQNLVARNKKTSESNTKAKADVATKDQERTRGGAPSVPEIMPVKVTEDNLYEEAGNENTGMFFVPVNEGGTSPYAVWGKASNVDFADGEEKFGIIIPIGINRSNNLYTKHGDEGVQQSVQDINNYVSEIEDIAFALDKKIYIDTSTMDDFSKSLLLERRSLSNYITNKYDEASILLPGPVCTPASFQRFVEELAKQQAELEGQERNPAI